MADVSWYYFLDWAQAHLSGRSFTDGDISETLCGRDWKANAALAVYDGGLSLCPYCVAIDALQTAVKDLPL